MKDSTLDRLRAANPAPTPPVREDEELFRRIVAEPRGGEAARGDEAARAAEAAEAAAAGAAAREAARRPRTRSSRRRLVFAVALGIAVLAASTALAISSLTGSTVVKPPVTLREYRLAQRQLTLPPGQTWPKLPVDPNSVTGRGAGGGHAVLIAQNRWECYWAHAIRTGDKPAQRTAQQVLRSLLAHNVLIAPPGAPEDYVPPNPPRVPYAVMADDGGYQFMQRTLDQAAAGHPRLLIESCRANR